MRKRGNRVSMDGLCFTFWKVIFFQLPSKGIEMIVVPISWMRKQVN